MSIIEDLYYGEIETGKASAEQLEILRLIDKNEQKLKNTFTQQQQAVFESLCDCFDELCEISSKEAFILGFSMGVKIVMESVMS